MKGKRCIVLFFILSAIAGQAGAAGVVVRIYPMTTVNCQLSSIQAKFTAAKSTYRMAGRCDQRLEYEDHVEVIPIPWLSEGAYAQGAGKVEETITLNGNPPYRGKIQTRLTCVEDPWLVIGKAACTQPAFSTGGDVQTLGYIITYLRGGFEQTLKPNTTGFSYDRAALVAQRPKDLLAEQQALAEAAEAARKRQNQRLQQAVQPGPAVIAPTILSPAAGALFLQNNAVPIKLIPPQGMAVTSFMVKLERRDSQGNWGLVTNLPVSAAEAASPTGYLGWGTPGSGRDPSRMVSVPGTYRLSAQISLPRQTGWSPPVEFVVTNTNKAIQKTPKMFAP